MAKIDKARFWTGVLYPENMREDWKEVIGDTLQYPMRTVSTQRQGHQERTPQRPCASDCGIPEHHNLQARFECHGFAFCGRQESNQ